MKKITSILLVFALLFAAFACTRGDDTDPGGTESEARFAPIDPGERGALFLYYYMTEWASLCANPPAGFDPGKVPDEQTHVRENGREETWAYYISRRTASSYNYMAAAYEDAINSEYYPDWEQLRELDGAIDGMKDMAVKQTGSVEAFLTAAYGPGFTEENFEKALTVDQFTKFYSSYWLMPIYKARIEKTSDAEEYAAQTGETDPNGYDAYLTKLAEAEIYEYYEQLAKEYTQKIFADDKVSKDGMNAALAVIRAKFAG